MAEHPAAAGRTGRNDPCPCGSGRRFRQCCGAAAPASGAARALAEADRLRRAGRAAEAAETLRRALRAAPEDPALALALGALLLEANAAAEAAPLLDALARRRPALAEARLRLGIAREQLGRFAEAAEAYRAAIAGGIADPEARERLAAVLLAQDQREAAAAAFRAAAALATDPARAQRNAAYALRAEERHEEAVAALRAALALDPADAAAQSQLGQLLAEAGDAAGAEAAFRAALAEDPRAVGRFYDLVRTRRLTEADRPLLDRMRQAAARDDLHPLNRVRLGLAIGKALDDLGEAEAGLAAVLEANRLKGRLRPLDRTALLRRTAWALRHLTAERLAAAAETGCRDATPILILGMPRSGTTLVESILASHASIGAGEELQFWNRRGRALVARDALPAPEEMREIADAYLAELRRLSGRPHVTDKKPDNFAWAGLIHLVFPRARIVHCRRDPRDTCVSILRTFFAPRPDFSTEPGDLAFYWRQYARVMAHWRAVLPPDRFLDLDYERLVTAPEPEIRRLLAFCGLGWDAACLRPERNRRRVSSASLWQVRRPIGDASVGQWRRHAAALGEIAGLGPG